jgi:nicotinamide-nucleotide amidase
MLDTEALAERAVRLLTERGLRLAVAESCTGGLIGHLLTDVPGASRCFLGAIVPYDNDAKASLLGVPVETMKRHGAVSEQTVAAMASGVIERFGADVGLAVTGVAGPGGGSAEKPVGLVYFAVRDRAGRSLSRRELHGIDDRRENKRLAAAEALRLVVEFVEAGRESQ